METGTQMQLPGICLVSDFHIESGRVLIVNLELIHGKVLWYNLLLNAISQDTSMLLFLPDSVIEVFNLNCTHTYTALLHSKL